MSKFPEFIENFSFININKMWTTMLFEDGQTAIKKVLTLTFRDEQIEDVLDNIHAGNFTQIIEVILDINGVDLKRQGDDEKNVERV
jgi:hypothetical protein